jgi:hypothetical protein
VEAFSGKAYPQGANASTAGDSDRDLRPRATPAKKPMSDSCARRRREDRFARGSNGSAYIHCEVHCPFFRRIEWRDFRD